MKTRSNSSIGALHPVLFFAGIYAIALLFSIFICSSLFYSCNATKAEVTQEKQAPVQQPLLSQSTVAVSNNH